MHWTDSGNLFTFENWNDKNHSQQDPHRCDNLVKRPRTMLQHKLSNPGLCVGAQHLQDVLLRKTRNKLVKFNLQHKTTCKSLTMPTKPRAGCLAGICNGCQRLMSKTERAHFGQCDNRPQNAKSLVGVSTTFCQIPLGEFKLSSEVKRGSFQK